MLLFLYCNGFILKPSSKIPFKIQFINITIIINVAILHEKGITKANKASNINSLDWKIFSPLNEFNIYTFSN